MGVSKRIRGAPDAFHAELDRAIRASGVFAKHNEHSAMPNAPRSQSIRLWEEMTDIPDGRAKVADREDIKASYVTVLRWIRDWRQKTVHG